QRGGGRAYAHPDGPELVVVRRRRQHMHDARAGTGTGIEREYPAPLINRQPGHAVAAGPQALPRSPRYGPRQGIHLQDSLTGRGDQHSARRMKGRGARGLAQPVDDHELRARRRVDDRELAVAARRVAGVHHIQQAVVADGEKASVRPGQRNRVDREAAESAEPGAPGTGLPRPAAVIAAPPACKSTVRTDRSAAATNETVWFEFTTAITCPDELVCSSASLHPAASASPSRQSRLMASESPPDHNTQTAPPAPRFRRADAAPGRAGSVPHTRTCETLRFLRRGRCRVGGR